MAGEYQRATEPDRTCRDPLKRLRAAQSFADGRCSGCHHLSGCNYSKGLRTHSDSAHAGGGGLGVSRTGRCSCQAGAEALHADPQDEETGDFPALSPKQPGCDGAGTSGAGAAAAILVASIKMLACDGHLNRILAIIPLSS